MISSLCLSMILSENRFPLFRIMLLDRGRSALCKGQRDKARRPTALDPHQHAVLVVSARGIDRLAHVTGVGDALPGDFEDHIAFLEAAIGRRTVRIYLGHHDAVPAGAGDAVGGRGTPR